MNTGFREENWFSGEAKRVFYNVVIKKGPGGYRPFCTGSDYSGV